MNKTGERYAAARRHLVGADQVSDAPKLPPRAAEPGMSDAAITRRTGRGWDDWFQLLDAWGGAARTHTEIARHVRDGLGVDGWTSQSVAVGYERARGLRAVHQTLRGFEVRVSKTVAASAEEVWAAFVEPTARKRWLEPGLLRSRSAAGTTGRSARFEVPSDGTRVNVAIQPKGEGRVSVAVNHERLADAADVAAHRAAWRARLDRLAALWTRTGVAPRRRQAS
jgi:hypothetical protein